MYNNRNPRPWTVEVLGDGDVAAVRGLVDLGQVVQQAPQQAQAPSPVIAAAQQRAAQALGCGQQAPVPQENPAYALYAEDIPF